MIFRLQHIFMELFDKYFYNKNIFKKKFFFKDSKSVQSPNQFFTPLPFLRFKLRWSVEWNYFKTTKVGL